MLFFKKKEHTLREKIAKTLEAVIIGAGLILFWRGIWMLADVYLFPDSRVISGTISLIIGLSILGFTENLIPQIL